LASRSDAVLALILIDIDPDPFLTDGTLKWYKTTLLSIGHPSQPIANEFIQSDRSDIIPTWYRQFQAIARDHVVSRNAPELALAPLL
jgi:hypothetical protein